MGEFRKHGNNWRKEKADVYKVYIKTSAVGLEVAISLLVGVISGFLLDKWFNIEPVGIILGMVIGSIAAAKALYNFSKKYINESLKLKNESKNESKWYNR